MTIILFLVDTSASMCQKAYVNGVQKTYLDIAKGAVETFLKYRQRTQDCLGDRYMLLTFEEPPSNVKAGWKENHATFMNELKNLQSTGLTSMGESLRNAFDLLNLNRMQSGIDTYGQGRCPFYLEPSVIIVITDGGRYSYRNGVHQEIILPLSTQVPGTKFTKEPFRWDQRLFSLVLRMAGNKIEERVEGKVPHDDSPIERMCEVTGGRSYRVRSHYVLNQCIESLVQKVQAGVVLQFEPLAPKEQSIEPDVVFQPTKKMIYVQKHISQKTFPIGYWPLPEPYWPDSKAVSLPPRDAHPKLKIFTAAVEEPQLVRSFPVDKYEVEASPLTLQILNKREMNKCWQVIVTNGMHGFELPFGYLKAAPNFTQVHLYVLAYNYPALLPLLNDLIHKYNMNPPNDLMYKFNSYVRSIPPYYCPFLRKALVNVNVPYTLLQFLLPENVDNYLSPTVANQLKHIKNTAKQDQENLCMKVYKQLKQPKPLYRQVETAKLNTGALLRRDLVRNPLLRDTFTKLHAEIEPVDNYTIVVPQLTRQSSAKTYRNPFDIPRRDMVEEIARMREVFLRAAPTSLVAKDSGHCLPISEMGNYQEYLKTKDNPLREIEPTNVRQHMFGNPYKKDKHMVMVDEADLSDVAPMKPNNVIGIVPGTASGLGVSSILLGGSKKMDGSRTRKRKAGPLPRNFEFRRLSVDERSPSKASSSSSRSNYDEDSSNSDTSSVCSGDATDESDIDRIGFDFNEEENGEQDTPLNGYVHNFINGINDENSMDSENSNSCASASTHAAPASVTTPTTLASGANPALTAVASSHQVNHDNVTSLTSPTSCHHYVIVNGMTQSMGYSGYAPHMPSHAEDRSNSVITSAIMGKSSSIVCNGYYNHITTPSYHPLSASPLSATSPLATIPSLTASPATAISTLSLSTTPPPLTISSTASTSAVTTTTASSTTSTATASTASTSVSSPSPYYSHSDINDASEISRILQQCHSTNGSGSSVVSSSSLSISNVLNGNSSTSSGSNSNDSSAESTKSTDVERSSTLTSAGNGSSASTSSSLLSNCFDSLKRETSNSNSTNNHHHPHLHWGSNSIQHAQAVVASTNSSSTSSTASVTNNNTNANLSSLVNSQPNHSSNHVNHSPGVNNHHALDNHQATQQQQKQQPLPNKASKAGEAAMPFTDEQRDAALKHNMDLRMQIFRDIRRPGRNYSQLLENLNLMKGDHEIMSDFIEMCINESLRFRRRQMVTSIQDWWDNKQQQQSKSLSSSPKQQQEEANVKS